MLENALWCAFDVDLLSVAWSLVLRKTDLFDGAVFEAEKHCTIFVREICDASDVGLDSDATESERI